MLDERAATTEKATNYGARAGETIAGNLRRGNDGKFSSGGSSDIEARARATVDAERQKPRKAKPASRRGRATARRRAAPTAPKTTEAQRAAAREQKRVQRVIARVEREDTRKREQNVRRSIRVEDRRQRQAAREAERKKRQLALAQRRAEVAARRRQRASGGKGRAAPRPKPAKAPEFSEAISAAAQALQEGAAVNEQDQAALIRAGLARTTRDGLILTDAGRRAARQAIATKEHSGAMLALFLAPHQAAPLRTLAEAVVDSQWLEPAEDYHITLCYLGTAADLGAPMREAYETALRTVAKMTPPLRGKIGGVGRFTADTEERTHVLYASFDCPGLPAFRQQLLAALQVQGIAPIEEHGFTPHITLAYIPADMPTPTIELPPFDVTVIDATLAWAGARTAVPLSGPALKESALAVFKDARGDLRWLSVSSTAFKDRDRQIVSSESLVRDIERSYAQGDHGPLRFWHVGRPDPLTRSPGPGLDIGDCDFRLFAEKEHSLVESGTFRRPEYAGYIRPGDQVSLGFFHAPSEPDAAGVFHRIHSFERSITPAGRASNPLTSITVKEAAMAAIPTEKGAEFLARGGDPALLEQLLTDQQGITQKAEQAGIAFKGDQSGAEGVIALLAQQTGMPADQVRAQFKEFLQTLAPAVPVAEALGLTEKAAPPPADVVEEDVEVEAPGDDEGPLLTEKEMDMIADRVVLKLGPALDMEGKMRGYADEVRNLFSQQTAKKDDAVAALQEQVAQLQGQLSESQSERTTLKQRLDTLEGDQPSGARGYRASQDPATVVGETPTTTTKDAAPAPDALEGLANFWLGNPGQQPVSVE